MSLKHFCNFFLTVDDVFVDPMEQALAKNKLFHKRSDSMTTTASESEFKRHYMSRRKCLIQRADSQQEYHRLSARVYGKYVNRSLGLSVLQGPDSITYLSARVLRYV